MKSGIAGRLAFAFIDSKLTPLLIVAALGVGLFTLATLPSEEEPQIVVPLADLYLPLPGATPGEVENRLLIPVEQVVSGIEGVEYVYGHAEHGFGLITVRFEVGRDMEESLVSLYSTLFKHADRMPPGFQLPLVKTVTVDDVPFFTVTLSGAGYEGEALRRLAEELRVELEAVPDVRSVAITGGEPREVRVELLPDRLAAYGMGPADVAARLAAANVRRDAGGFARGGRALRVTAGPFLTSARDVESVVLDVRDGAVVQVRDVARVVDGPAEVSSYAFTTAGAGWAPMVALAVAKRAGSDATALGRALEQRIETLEGRLLPGDVRAAVVRNYGETARDKVTTLQEHLLLAVLAVGLVVALTMGWRSALVVMTAVPVTFALTLFVYQVLGYTLNRVTLFALIFVTGIVIDDSIIVAENMGRHFAMRDRPLRAAARAAVDEVGNPTILATLTVIAAVLPMLFVSGLMGPYMSPMPVGATVAMLFSLGVALIATPWLSYRLLRGEAHADGGEYVLEKTRAYRLYARVMTPLLDRPRRLVLALAGVALLLAGSVAMFPTRMVPVKMLPFDDKNEVLVVVDMPEGTPLERTLAVAQDLGEAVRKLDEVTDLQLYAGTAAPFNFNGMIRHYYLRAGDAVADLQINLVDKGARDSQSHDIARRIRPLVQAAARGTGASVKVVEVPPGPPVLSTLVAEIYAPTEAQRTAIAERVVDRFEAHPSVVDVDWSRSAPQPELAFLVDPDRAARAGVARPAVVEAIEAALGGRIATHLRDPDSREPVPVRVRLTEPVRSGLDRLAGLHVRSGDGSMVPLLELVRVVERTSPQVVDRKNGRPVLYVTAEVAGGQESPVYAMLDLKPELAEIEVSDGPRVGAANGTGVGSAGRVELAQIFAGQPGLVESPVLKWDGEWQITYEVFRDLGIAFAGALLLIYVLIVGWFGSFTTPLLMMAAIPLTLIGIAPGHWAFGAFFTATSMIGLIALAGIMVRNGILLIDYLEVRLAQHVPLKQAVLEAGAVRARPIALTAGTVVIGALVILFDPIFQGLAVSLVTGAVASTILTLVVVPGLYFLAHRRRTTDAEPPRDTRAGDATPRSRPADDAPPTPDAPPVEKPVDAKAALPDVADSAVERPAPDPPVEVPR